MRERPLYYDKEANPISDTLEWARLFENREYRIVKQETLWWGAFLSTVWLGLDHAWGGEKPLIFESMLFFGRTSDLDSRRYSTLEEAIQGHNRLKAYWSNPLNVVCLFADLVWRRIQRMKWSIQKKSKRGKHE
jgi:hypothetical protein